jgi:hypothetical protein
MLDTAVYDAVSAMATVAMVWCGCIAILMLETSEVVALSPTTGALRTDGF